jgi:uncharacterized protein (DUF305 family)
MALWFRISSAAVLLLCAAARAQQTPIVQPGAPGENSKVLSPAAARVPSRAPFAADVNFMQGMIHHHQQAVEMVALLRTHGRNKAVQKLGERISISQTDEIQSMRQWLEERGQAVPMEHAHMQHMAQMGRQSMDMGAMAPMPGMLTAAQMKELAASNGAKFDHLFLTGMIQHHTGALIMVQELMDQPGAAQDTQLYDFSVDIENTQTAEINIMKGMLQKEKK